MTSTLSSNSALVITGTYSFTTSYLNKNACFANGCTAVSTTTFVRASTTYTTSSGASLVVDNSGGSMWSNSTPTRFTPIAAGVYKCTGQFQLVNSVANALAVTVSKNGTDIRAGGSSSPDTAEVAYWSAGASSGASNNVRCSHVSGVAPLVVGDYMEFRFLASGGTLTSLWACFFVERVV